MNIKSILLGTAAALVAVSGARAADAVVMVEPEPVEYVRVCDVYGTGFFYIPGTETCLKIGGYVRMRLEANDHADTSDFGDLDSSTDGHFQTRVRARLNFDAREETELGTLRAFARVQATNTSGAGEDQYYKMDQAYIQLGGLTIGYLDSLWAERDGLYTDTDWSVGDFNQNRISYTYAANGFSAALSLEDDGDGDFVPDVIGQLAYEGGWGSAYVSGVYDEDTSADYTYRAAVAGTSTFDPVTGVITTVDPVDFLAGVDGGDNASDGAFAVKAGVELKDLLVAGSLFKIEGHYASDPTRYAVDGYINQGVGTTFDAGQLTAVSIPSEYQIGAAYQQSFGKLTAILSGVYGETFDFTYNGTDYDSSEYYGVAGNLGYQITSNFSVLGEVSYRDVNLKSGFDDFDQTTGFLEFQRTF